MPGDSVFQGDLRDGRRLSAGVVAATAVAGLLVVATAGLWAHYGTAVFIETIMAGIAACF